MDLTLHVYHHVGADPVVLDKLDDIYTALQTLLHQGVTMAATYDDLLAQVKANTDAEQSAALVLKQIHEQLVAAQATGDPAKIQAAIDQLGASQAVLAAAVKESTPGA